MKFSPLRRAVLTCLGYQAPWTDETVQGLAGVTRLAVRMYLSQLVSRGVLLRGEAGYSAGPLAAEYRAQKPKTKPGGNSLAYRRAQRLRSEMATREWHDRRAGLTSAPVEQEQTAGMSGEASNSGGLVKISEVARMMDVHISTIRRWILTGKLRGVRTPTGVHRVYRSELERLLGHE